jgi:UDP-N-acetyl-D-glucosamine dehydrogenase
MRIALSDALRAKISDRTAVIGIIGMGYVGLPLTLSEKGFRVLGSRRWRPFP